MKIVFIGVGKMARAMIEGWQANAQGEKHEFFLFDRKDSGLEEYVSSFAKSKQQFHVFDDSRKMTKEDFALLFGDEKKNRLSEIEGFVFLAVKPNDLESAVGGHSKLISRCIENNFPIVSIMAGVKLEKIRQAIFKNFDRQQISYHSLSFSNGPAFKYSDDQREIDLSVTYCPLVRQNNDDLDKNFRNSYSSFNTADLSSFNPPIIRLMPNLTAKYGAATGAYCSYDGFDKERIVLSSLKDSSKKVTLAFLESLLDELEKEIAQSSPLKKTNNFSPRMQSFFDDLAEIFQKEFFDDWQTNQSKRNAFKTFLTDKIFLPIQNHQESILQMVFEKFDTLLQPLGVFQKVTEDKMDIVTALAGSGPAFVAIFTEALSDAGVCHGLSRKDAIKMSLQILKGTALYLDYEKMHPAVFKDAVASPGGTTIEGLKTLENKGFRASVLEAVASSLKKARNLSREKKYKNSFPANKGN